MDSVFVIVHFDFKWSNEENHVSKPNTICQSIQLRCDRLMATKKSNYLHTRAGEREKKEEKNICLIIFYIAQYG